MGVGVVWGGVWGWCGVGWGGFIEIFRWFYGWLVNPPLRVWWGWLGFVGVGMGVVWGGAGRVYGDFSLVLWLVGEPALTGLVGLVGFCWWGWGCGVRWGGAGL